MFGAAARDWIRPPVGGFSESVPPAVFLPLLADIWVSDKRKKDSPAADGFELDPATRKVTEEFAEIGKGPRTKVAGPAKGKAGFKEGTAAEDAAAETDRIS
jgi:hypothetical protein